jgi:hypothetical protein
MPIKGTGGSSQGEGKKNKQTAEGRTDERRKGGKQRKNQRV